ncbi:MAG: hypothetical protein AAGK97_15965, partial [Bacteroidota bacterium]
PAILIVTLCFTLQLLGAANPIINIDSTYSEDEIEDFINEGIKEKDSLKLGKAFLLKGKFDRDNNYSSLAAIRSFERSAELFTQIKDTLLLYKALVDKGALLLENLDHTKAIESFLKIDLLLDSTQLDEKTKNYKNLSIAYAYNKEYELALQYLDKSLLAHINEENDYLIAKDKLTKAIILFDLKQYNRAIENAKQSLKLSSDLKEFTFVSQNLQILGKCYFKKRRFRQAMDNLLEAERFALKTDNRQVLKSIYQDISDAYRDLGNFEEALDYHRLYSSTSESIMLSEHSANVAELSKNYFTEKQRIRKRISEDSQRELEISERSQTITSYSILVGLATMLFASYFIIRMYQQRLNSQDVISKQQEELNDQKIKELENNIRMESMYSMMEGQEKERERIAKDLHD